MDMDFYYTEDQLIDMMQSPNFSNMEYVLHHSPEYNEEYKVFCRQRGYTLDETSAIEFLDKKDLELEKAIFEGRA